MSKLKDKIEKTEYLKWLLQAHPEWFPEDEIPKLIEMLESDIPEMENLGKEMTKGYIKSKFGEEFLK